MMEIRNYNFNRSTDWVFEKILGAYLDFQVSCTARNRQTKQSINATVVIDGEGIQITFPASVTNLKSGIFEYDVEINQGDLGDPNNYNFTTTTIQRGQLAII